MSEKLETVIHIRPEHAKGTNYSDNDNCALARAMRAAGLPVKYVLVSCARGINGEYWKITPPFHAFDFNRVENGETFVTAATRYK